MSRNWRVDTGRLRALMAMYNERRAKAREGRTVKVGLGSRPDTGYTVSMGSKEVPMEPDGPPLVEVQVPMPEIEIHWLLWHCLRAGRELDEERLRSAGG